VRRVVTVVAGLATVVLLVWGLARLFKIRFQTGDAYPTYSTFRAGPKGCRAYYEALGRIEGVRVERNFTPSVRLKNVGSDALLILGYKAGLSVPEGDAEEVERLALSGARIVFAFDALAARFFGGVPVGSDPPSTEGVDAEEEDSGDKLLKAARGEKIADLEERWGFRFEKAEIDDRPEGGWETKTEGGFGEKEVTLPEWTTPWRFGLLDGEWETIVRVGGDPAVVRRSFGEGEIILAGDTYFASNEGLWHGGNTRLLLWLTGDRERVIFDETHLGTVINPGVMSLVKRYRLYGFFLGLTVLVLLYAWKNGNGLVPPDEEAEARVYVDATVMGADANTGFLRLLQSNIPQVELLSVCYKTWFKSPSRPVGFTSAKADVIISLIEEEEKKGKKGRNLVATYNRVAETVARKDL